MPVLSTQNTLEQVGHGDTLCINILRQDYNVETSLNCVVKSCLDQQLEMTF